MPSSQQSDATFVSTTEESQPLSPRATYVIPKNALSAQARVDPNATFQVSDEAAKMQPINDQTIVVTTKSNGGAIRKKKMSAASIMTEDDSDSSHSNEDVPLSSIARMAIASSKTASAANKKNPKELFKWVLTDWAVNANGIQQSIFIYSPCVQKTTVKQKAEAFEKLASPVAAPRETRTRTRNLTNTDGDVSMLTY